MRRQQNLITPNVVKLPSPQQFVGIYFDFTSAMQYTIARILKTLPVLPPTSSNLMLEYKFRFDGSGNHSVYIVQSGKQCGYKQHGFVFFLRSKLKMRKRAFGSNSIHLPNAIDDSVRQRNIQQSAESISF